MVRVAGAQGELFSPVGAGAFQTGAGEGVAVAADALGELWALLALVRGVDRLPWDGAWAAMEQEQRALSLARLAGPEGAEVLSALFAETERLWAATD